jgi:hypothetical protein
VVRTLLILATLFGGVHAGENSCDIREVTTGTCSIDASLDSGGATLEGITTAPNSGGSVDVDGGGDDTSDDDHIRCIYRIDSRCLMRSRAGKFSSSITFADIAHFRPQVGAHTMEPDGWVVTGLPANFISSAGVQVVPGTLLGAPAAVKFSPVAWHWDYGDGSLVSHRTGGGSWQSLGIPEFDRTPTSHVFDRDGQYTVSLTVEFAAEYRARGSGWTTIPGTVALAADPLTVVSVDATTVLMDHDCLANPAGPGC